MVGIASPDTGNLMVGKGFILFKPTGASAFYDVGNVPSFTFTPAVETLEHFSSREGVKLKDQTFVLTKGGEITMDMEEITAKNLAMLMLGTANDTNPETTTVDIFSQTSLTGELRYYATNEIGPRWYATFNKVTFNPSGEFSPISDEIAVLSVTGSVEAVNGDFGVLTLKPPVLTVAPENVLAPFIHGTRLVGDVHTVYGSWVGASSFTYQWKRDGHDIVGATSKTYTTVIADDGSPLTVLVTATNTIGSTALTTAEFGPIGTTL
jgi:hypothetical protein